MTYDDPILSPASWPGTRLRYAAHADRLVLTLSFDAPGGTSEFAYRTAAAQLADPALAIALTATFAPGVLDDGTLLRPFLEEHLASRNEASLVVPLTVAEPNGYAFPVAVALTLSRPAGLVHRTGGAASVPGSDTVTMAVPPDLDDPDAFAALAGWHVAVDPSTVTALRWTATPGGDPAYLAIPPPATAPVGGSAEVVTAYDEAWHPTTAVRTFSGIDLGEWARIYLDAVETLPARFDPVRARLAAALAASVVPLSPGGDVDAAREAVSAESPAAAYAASAVAQVPFAVTGPAATTLSGAVDAAPATLPLSGDPAWLTFVVTASEPVAHLPMAVRFTPDHVVRDTPLGPRRLRLLAADAVDAGAVDVPVPARPLPHPPVLAEQSAEQAPGGTFAWDHTVAVELPGLAPQDEVTLLVVYGDPPPRPVLAAPPPPGPLFEALAAFVTAWPLLPVETPSDAVLDVAEALVVRVADAWEAAVPPPAALPPPPGDPWVVSWRDGVRVRARAGDLWPTLNGVSPASAARDDDGWYTAEYPGLALDASLSCVWRLDARTHPNASTSCRVTRNASLPAPFVMTTPWVSFATPAVPLLDIGSPPPTPPGPTLAATLATALADVVSWATPPGRTLRLELAYSYALEGADRVSLPVLAHGDVPLPPDYVEHLASEVDAWFDTSAPPTTDARIEATATVDGGSLPLVRFEPIAATVPDGWWTA